MIPRETVDTILETARIEEIVGEFVNLKKRGANLLGLCPFHNEKTPSFTVSPAKGFYKCFGCGEGGSSVNFLMAHEHYTYPEALKYLAKKYQIEIEEEELTPEMAAEQSERESQFIVTAYAENYFVEQLWESDTGQAIGLSYFRERGFSDETIKKFRLGYSQEKWDNFTTAAMDNGYQKEFLVKTGLAKEKDGKVYDGYRGRVMFPIHNLSGRPIGFGGRTLRKDKKTPKYINTPECDIYNKRKVLYGLFQGKKSVVGEDNCFLVEGYTDVISLSQAGIENVVASSGTSLTQDQIRLIRRYTKNITILYDGDPAGIKASFRGIDLILEEGMSVRVVMFPDGEDPDSFARSREPEELKEYISENAKDFIVFKTDLLYADTEGDPIKKSKLIHEIVDSIALIPDSISRSLYLQQCARIVQIPESALLTELNKARRKLLTKKGKEQEAPMEPPPQDASDPLFIDAPAATISPGDSTAQEREIIRILLTHVDKTVPIEVITEGEVTEIEMPVPDYILHELSTDQIKMDNPKYQQIIEQFHLMEHREDGDAVSRFFFHHDDPEVGKISVDLLSPKYELHNWEKVGIFVTDESKKMDRLAIRGMYYFKIKRVQRMMEEVLEKMKQASENGEDFTPFIQMKQRLDEARKKLAETIGKVVPY